ncbi:MAG: hypothetical protein NZM15_04105 [Flavobacteriales bacterium]|nr:hypothetical protein [Flavobacteriales bacterium]MDW8431868.1 hypothetical protein [Flavobacteriales bacterium]
MFFATIDCEQPALRYGLLCKPTQGPDVRWLSRRLRRRIEAPRYCAARRAAASSMRWPAYHNWFLKSGPSIRRAKRGYSGTGCAVAE